MVVIGTLYWAQAVFIPVALAAFLTFLLSPLVNRLRQRGLPRTPSVIVVVLLAAIALGGVGWLVTSQISSLLQELPKYRQTVKEKVRSRSRRPRKASGQLEEMVSGRSTRRSARDAGPAPAEASRREGEPGTRPRHRRDRPP